MLKRLFLCLSLFSATALRAGTLDGALAAASDLQARIGASSSLRTPSASNFQSVQGDAAALKGFADNLARQLSGLNIGPAADVRSASVDLSVRVGTLQGMNVLNLSAFIDACKGAAGQMDALQGMLPGLISALKAEKSRALIAVQTATQWSPPTPIPGTGDPGSIPPTPTPMATWVAPVASPAPTPFIPVPVGGSPPPMGVSNPGTLPGGPTLPPLPPPPAGPTPIPSAAPTPRPALRAPVAVLPIGAGGDDHAHSNSGKVYVANVNGGSVAVLDTDLKRVLTQIPVGLQPVALAKNGLVLVANYGSNTVSLIDPDADAVVATLNVGSQPVDLAASGGEAYVVNQGSNSVSVIDMSRRKVIKTISVGQQPSRITVAGESGRAYVTNTNEDSIAIIDTKNDELVATVSE
jgi:YVTN family beta-propeller protein